MSTIQNDIFALRMAVQEITKCLDSMEARIQEESGIATGYTRPHVKAIFEVVCEHYKIPISMMGARNRRASISMPRQVAMFLARELTRYHTDDIAKCFRPDMDHGTICHGVKRITDQMSYDTDLRATIEMLSIECRKRMDAANEAMRVQELT